MASGDRLKWLVVEPNEIKAHWPKDENWYWKWYSLERDVSWGRACVNVTRRCVSEFGFSRLMTAHASWLAQSGRGLLIGQSACRLLGLPHEAIDTMGAGATGSLHSAATIPILLDSKHKIDEKGTYQRVSRSNKLFKIYKLGSHQHHFS